MPDILREATIFAPPDKIYTALTEQDGIRSWWTQQANAAPKIGSVTEVKFYNGQVVMQIEVEQLDPNRVVWAPEADQVWRLLANDQPLPKSVLSGSLSARHIPGVTKHPGSGKQEQAAAADNLANGLCA